MFFRFFGGFYQEKLLLRVGFAWEFIVSLRGIMASESRSSRRFAF